MFKYFCVILLLFLFSACQSTEVNKEKENKTNTEKFLRGVYCCNPSVVDELAGDSIIISYPIFEKPFGSPIIQGRDSAKNFAEGFCSQWKDAQIKIHDAVAEGNNVVLVWSFSAINVGTPIPDVEPTNQEESWGGITLFRFNNEGKIIAEIGEESTPGPSERSELRKD